MPASVEPVPPQVAMMIDEKMRDGDRQLYRALYFSRQYPDETNLNSVLMVKVAVHFFAVEGRDAYEFFMNNVPDHYPVFMLVEIVPVRPDLPEDSMIGVEAVTQGPRAVQ